MPKRRTPTIPPKCPICGALYWIGKPNQKITGGEVMEVKYDCGGHVSLYRFPEGWRLDIFECKEQKQPQQETKKTKERWLFTDQEGGL